MNDNTTLACFLEKRTTATDRYDTLNLALRTPGLNGHRDVLAAAKAYQAHIEGDATENQCPAPGAAHPGYSTLQPHQQRVVDEKAELDGKHAKLIAFFNTETFAEQDVHEQSRLMEQSAVMQEYSEILGARIEAFGLPG